MRERSRLGLNQSKADDHFRSNRKVSQDNFRRRTIFCVTILVSCHLMKSCQCVCPLHTVGSNKFLRSRKAEVVKSLGIGVYFLSLCTFFKLLINLIIFLLLLSHLTPLYLFYAHLILITILFPFPVPLDILTLSYYVLQNSGITYL